MATSTCKATKHNEYDCIIKWGVSGKKYNSEKWCASCKEKYKTYIENGIIK